MMVIVFDLDDTLYEEQTFVRSGFRAVAQYLQDQHGLNADAVAAMLVEAEKGGRGALFDQVLEHHGLLSRALVRKCVSVYRLHKPDIALPAETLSLLHDLRAHPLYVVTDGNKVVQRNKIAALQLERFMRRSLVTHEFGVHNAKPSPYCFFRIAAMEKCAPDEIVYVGDNISKDFVSLKPLGFKTVRVLQGNYVGLERSPEYHAQHTIARLGELRSLIEQKRI